MYVSTNLPDTSSLCHKMEKNPAAQNTMFFKSDNESVLIVLKEVVFLSGKVSVLAHSAFWGYCGLYQAGSITGRCIMKLITTITPNGTIQDHYLFLSGFS